MGMHMIIPQKAHFCFQTYDTQICVMISIYMYCYAEKSEKIKIGNRKKASQK